MMHIVNRNSNIILAGSRAFAIVWAAAALATTCLAQAAPTKTENGSTSTAAAAAVPTMPSLNQHHHRDSDDSDPYSVQNRQRFPFFASLGVFIPNFSDPGVSSSAGGDFAFGYRMPFDSGEARITLRSQTFGLDDGFGDHTDATIGQLGIDAMFRAGQIYAGGGIAAGEVSGVTNGFPFTGSDATVWSLLAGYDINPRIFVEARWQTANVDAYKGYTIAVGYRF